MAFLNARTFTYIRYKYGLCVWEEERTRPREARNDDREHTESHGEGILAEV